MKNKLRHISLYRTSINLLSRFSRECKDPAGRRMTDRRHLPVVGLLVAALAPLSSQASLAFEAAQPDARSERSVGEAYQIRVLDAPKLFLSADQMRCPGVDRNIGSQSDISDIPVSAFRRKDGKVIVFSGNQNNYYLVGDSVEDAKRESCAHIIGLNNKSDPSKYSARRWLFTAYAKDYSLVLGFVHNEYHGRDFSNTGCDDSGPGRFKCWYASTTLVTSQDGGDTFQEPPPPDNVLASLPQEFRVGQNRAGLFSPKVVGNPNDNMVYVMVTYVDQNGGSPLGQCLLRGSGRQLRDWRGWDGSAFTLEMGSPYAGRSTNRRCASVLNFSVRSVKYIPRIRQFVAIGNNGNRVFYAFSPDLIRWSRRQQLDELSSERDPAEINRQDPRTGRLIRQIPKKTYFSILDSGSNSINFDTVEGNPYIYYVQRRDDGPERDIYRVPIQISK